MGCGTSDDKIPPAASLSVESTVKDERLIQAVNAAGSALKKAGVSRVRVTATGLDDSVDIIPVGGNKDDVNKVLDQMKRDIEKAGYSVYEAPVFRCANSPLELRVYRQGAAR